MNWLNSIDVSEVEDGIARAAARLAAGESLSRGTTTKIRAVDRWSGHDSSRTSTHRLFPVHGTFHRTSSSLALVYVKPNQALAVEAGF